jgi:hypothetical protein
MTKRLNCSGLIFSVCELHCSVAAASAQRFRTTTLGGARLPGPRIVEPNEIVWKPAKF